MTSASDFDRVVMEFMADDPLTVTYNSNTTTYSDATGLTTVNTVAIPCQAVFLEIDPHKLSGNSSKDMILQGDKLLFLRPPEKVDPYRLPLVINQAADSILVGTTEYTIVTYKQTNPSATNCILYELYIRN